DDVRLAQPGEFSARAFLHGRISIEQAEGIAWTIACRDDAELEASRDILSGRAGQRTSALADTLAHCLALVEAAIDFTDQEDVVAITPHDLHERVSEIAGALAQQLSDGGARMHAGYIPCAALVGAPSTGKSTLFNALLGRTRAVVHEDKGTTRDVLRETLALDSILPAWRIELQDLPGLDLSATDEPSRAAQAAARRALANADVLVWCDPTGRFDESHIDAGNARLVRVRTKADLPGDTKDTSTCAVCALDGWGLDATRRAISDAAWACTHTRGSARHLIMPRHEHALRCARDELQDAIALIAPQDHTLDEPELVADRLRSALDALGAIAGHIDPDEIIGRVFASFCVGK
ncbi:MAG: GTPase, partial [Planctomycetota bacterium]